MCHKAQRSLKFLRNASEEERLGDVTCWFYNTGTLNVDANSLNPEGSLKCRSETIQEKERLAI